MKKRQNFLTFQIYKTISLANYLIIIKQFFSITHCMMILTYNLPDLVRKLAADEFELTHLLIKILLLSVIHQSPQCCLLLECLFIYMLYSSMLVFTCFNVNACIENCSQHTSIHVMYDCSRLYFYRDLKVFFR